MFLQICWNKVEAKLQFDARVPQDYIRNGMQCKHANFLVMVEYLMTISIVTISIKKIF